MKNKTYLAVLGLSAILLASATSLAFAKPDNHPSKPQPMAVHISSNGKALLRGTVDSVSSNSFMVKSWGGDWLVDVSSDTKFTPKKVLGNITPGDAVSVNGIVSPTSNWTIDATAVHD